MAQKPFLHELLKDDQEPFRLKTYIADRRSQLQKPPSSKALQLSKRSCFLWFPNSPDVRGSPLFDFPSLAKSPCRSPNGSVFLHVPSRTAALLVEAAMRIHKPRAKSHTARNVGLGLFGTFLKRLKERNRSRTRSIDEDNGIIENANRASCSGRVIGVNRARNTEDESLDLEASISGYGFECSNSDSVSMETRFCQSPFEFSLERSPPPTPDFCSPAASPTLQQNQEKGKYKSRNSENLQREEEEEKEQCSPVSVLEPPYEDYDKGESGEADADDFEMECAYKNVQRIRQHLLYRLQRFEKLAAFDTTKLGRNLLQVSDYEDLNERPSSMYINQTAEDVLTQGYNRIASPDMTRLVYDLIVEENGEIAFTKINEMLTSQIYRRLESWEEVKPNTIDMMVGLDLMGKFGRWTNFDEELREISAEMEISICGLLMEELWGDLLNMDGKCW